VAADADRLAARVRETIRDVPDFPQPGILFKDITPVLAEGALLQEIVDRFAEQFSGMGVQRVAGIESRGFILAAPLAVSLGVGFAPLRKPGKLPHQRVRVDYALEYGSDALEAHVDAFRAGEQVLLVDDVLATGGTAAGAVELIRRLGASVLGTAFLVELGFLRGRRRLGDVPVFSMVEYPG
jgi:adenine phosphoribosyltransferase